MEHIRAQEKAWDSQYQTHGNASESSCGMGSYLENTVEIREALPRLFKKYNIKTMVDVPCGDWNWMQHVDLMGVEYLGLDVVPSMIQENRKKFTHVEFKICNILEDEIPQCDLILCRDFLFHLSNGWALTVLEKFKRSGSRYLLSTSFPDHIENEELILSSAIGWRAVNLTKAPFNLQDPIEAVQEKNNHACRGRIVGLFDLEAWK